MTSAIRPADTRDLEREMNTEMVIERRSTAYEISASFAWGTREMFHFPMLKSRLSLKNMILIIGADKISPGRAQKWRELLKR